MTDTLNKTDEIIINQSSIPIIRVGGANIILVATAILTFILFQLFKQLDCSMYLQILACISLIAFGVTWYLNVVSRISLKSNGEVVFTTPIKQAIVKLNEVRKVKIKYLRLSQMLIIYIWKKNSFWPTTFKIAEISTNIGWLPETKQKLEAMFGIDKNNE